MFEPLAEIEEEDKPDQARRKLQWEGRAAAFEAAKKAFIQYNSSPEGILAPEGAPPVPDCPDQPVPLRITISDITSQKMVRQAADRPRGLLCVLDEMNGWVRKLIDKSSGEDRSAWVVSYESSRYEMDRVGTGTTLAENMAVSIYGNMQPTVFRDNLDNLASDGLIQRFIPAVLRPKRWGIGHPVPEYLTNKPQWAQTLRIAFALPAQTYTLSPEAATVYRDFQHWYEQAKDDERIVLSSDAFLTAFGKLEGTVGRLALLFHVIESPFSPVVSADLMRRVVTLVKSYVVPSFRYSLTQMTNETTFDAWMADYIIRVCDELQTVNLIELRRLARHHIGKFDTWKQNQMVLGAMNALERAKWVMRIDDGTRENQHYAIWAIKPTLCDEFRAYRKRVIDAKQRQREEIYKLSPKKAPKIDQYTDE